MDRAVAMRKQGTWTRWEQVMERKITWNDLWKMDSQSIKFLIMVVYDILPSPSNLHHWGLEEQPTCSPCERIGTLEHILSCCSRALADGRYQWRHDQVLRTIAETISNTLNICRRTGLSRNTIHFVKCWPMEVGCRGFVGQSLCRAYRALGIIGEKLR